MKGFGSGNKLGSGLQIGDASGNDGRMVGIFYII
jgi:hypothetical protein